MKQMQRVLLILGIMIVVAAYGQQEGVSTTGQPTSLVAQPTNTVTAPTETQTPSTAIQPTVTAQPTALPTATATAPPTAPPVAISTQIAPTEQPTSAANAAAASPITQATAPSLAPNADPPADERARADLAQRLSRSVDEVQVISVEEDAYPISALNCGAGGNAKPAQAETTGLTVATKVVLRIDEQNHTYYVQKARMSYCPPL